MSSNRPVPLVVTTCTASKRTVPDVRLESVGHGSQEDVAAAWQRILAGSTPSSRAAELYRGRAFAIATAAARHIGSGLLVISAGLGLVTANTNIPSYDITLRRYGPASIQSKIVGPFDPQKWWKGIVRGPYSADPAREFSGRQLLLCLSESYLAMVRGELEAYVANGGTLRIFGLSLEKHAGGVLSPYVAPYDERLSALGRSGTRVDFPQRALLHYLEHIAGAALPLPEERAAIEAALSQAPAKSPVPQKPRLSDPALKSLIAELLPKIGHSRTRMLAHVRRVSGFACEQARFFRLCDEVFGGQK